jgi:hypothetical protein
VRGERSPLARERTFVGPQAEAALERAVVVAAADVGRQIPDETDVAAPEHDVFGGDGGAETLGRVHHGGLPRFVAERLASALAAVVLERLVAIRQVRQFERHDAALVDERGAQP